MSYIIFVHYSGQARATIEERPGASEKVEGSDAWLEFASEEQAREHAKRVLRLDDVRGIEEWGILSKAW